MPANLSEAEEPERWVRAYWDQDVKDEFKCSLQFKVNNRRGMLADLTTQLASMRVMIHSVSMLDTKGHEGLLNITIGVNGLEHLAAIKSKLLKIEGVLAIDRI